MTVSLHTATIGAWLQTLPAMAGLIDKAEAHCRTAGLPDAALAGARLADDMWPFAKQITSVVHHSQGALAGLRAGVFGPDLSPAPEDFASLREAVVGAIAVAQAVLPEEIDAIANRDMRFEYGQRRMDFTVSDFLLSFSLPNFQFHATTAYAILRHQGVPLGKMDFLGKVRFK